MDESFILTVKSGTLTRNDFETTSAYLEITGGALNSTYYYVETGYTIDVERDLLGRITRKTETVEDYESEKTEIEQSYEYDLSGRLIKVTTDNSEETYAYDANGNRTHRNGTEIATFDAQDRILRQNGTTYQHNALGQRTEKNEQGQKTAYRYDNLGGLREVTLPDNTTIGYVLDPTGRRVGRKENGQWTHKWIYQDGLNPIAELDENDRIRKAFIYADKGHVPAYMITYSETGSEIGQYRIVSDLLGSVRLVYDLTWGDEAQRIDYDVWGNITNDTNPDFQPFGFAGGLYDSKTKLTRFGARDYDAETGRWTAKDPIGFNGGNPNLYGYVSNDPINFIDPLGLLDTCNIEDCKSEHPYGSTPYWLDQYVMSTNNWGEALDMSRQDKMRPGLDADNRTAAEHYSFMRSVLQGQGGVTRGQQVSFMALGWAGGTYYQGRKAFNEIFGDGTWSPSPPSMEQWRWENAGWYDHWDPRSPFYVPPPFGRCR